MIRSSFWWGVLGACCALAAPVTGQDTNPVEGLREHRPAVYALTGGKVVVAPGRVLESATIVIRDGRITAVGSEAAVPQDARTIDCQGKTLYAGLIDAYGEVELAASGSGAPYWNSSIAPHRRVADSYTAANEENQALLEQGVVARLVSPSDGIIKGRSALVSTGELPNAQAVVHDDVALHIRLTVSRGRGRDEYPNSPMGAVALARQAMLDGEWYQRAWTAHRADSTVPRPDHNDALEALQPYLNDGRLTLIDAANDLYLLRADRFAREFSLRTAIIGSGHEYRRLDDVRRTGRSVIVPVNFAKAPNVGTPEAARDVTLERLMHWDLAKENPARLAAAGVSIAFTSHGLESKKDLLKMIRMAVQRGLSADQALAALTTTPAELFEVANQLGTIEAGKMASLLICDGPLFEKRTKVVETWVAGQRYEHQPPPVVDARGTWRVTAAGTNRPMFQLTISGTGERLSGHVTGGGNDDDQTKLGRVGMSDARLAAVFEGEKLGRAGIVQFSAVLIGTEPDSQAGSGVVVWPDGQQQTVTVQQVAKSQDAKDDQAQKDRSAAETEDSKSAGDEQETAGDESSSYEVNYPLGAFGRSGVPEQPEHVLFSNATVWTCGPQGILENAAVLVHRGKIVAVGKDLTVPSGAVIVDCGGKHISPGIIDCHSHIATDGGVNESAQAITAEVRIGDFIDSDDISIYRQLAGGVTAANILHGSANPIGGQNQVIKFRWGAASEAMKFVEAPAGIKFALGENVKQANWGDDYTTRYPQTRMGVDQLIRDAFQRARQYDQQRQNWQRDGRGLPPRRDLELEALAEILRGERWIHCHSYRQDEILALIRTLDDFGITIGTFQHILEGYKVANEMAAHGAMGSSFSDWWAYKFEVYDAIPHNGALMHRAGVVVSFNSDDSELARHLNHEAAKAVKYGGVPPVEALKFVTLNPARQLRIDQYVGSLESGKHADLVVWSDSPLSTLSRCEQTWIDGRRYFDRDEDRALRDEVAERRAVLVQKILNSGEVMLKAGEKDSAAMPMWPREDLFCHPHHGHDDH